MVIKPQANKFYKAKDKALGIFVKLVVTNVTNTDIMVKVIYPSELKNGSVLYSIRVFKAKYRITLDLGYFTEEVKRVYNVK